MSETPGVVEPSVSNEDQRDLNSSQSEQQNAGMESSGKKQRRQRSLKISYEPPATIIADRPKERNPRFGRFGTADPETSTSTADPVSMLSGTQNLEPAVEKANEPVTITDKMESEEPLKRRFSRRSTGVKMSQVPDVVETSTLIALASTAGVDESVNQDSKREEQLPENIFPSSDVTESSRIGEETIPAVKKTRGRKPKPVVDSSFNASPVEKNETELDAKRTRGRRSLPAVEVAAVEATAVEATAVEAAAVTDDADRSAPIDDKEESGPSPAVIEKRGRRSLSKQQRLATEASRTESPTSTKRSNSRKLKSDETSKESDVKLEHKTSGVTDQNVNEKTYDLSETVTAETPVSMNPGTKESDVSAVVHQDLEEMETSDSTRTSSRSSSRSGRKRLLANEIPKSSDDPAKPVGDQTEDDQPKTPSLKAKRGRKSKTIQELTTSSPNPSEVPVIETTDHLNTDVPTRRRGRKSTAMAKSVETILPADLMEAIPDVSTNQSKRKSTGGRRSMLHKQENVDENISDAITTKPKQDVEETSPLAKEINTVLAVEDVPPSERGNSTESGGKITDTPSANVSAGSLAKKRKSALLKQSRIEEIGTSHDSSTSISITTNSKSDQFQHNVEEQQSLAEEKENNITDHEEAVETVSSDGKLDSSLIPVSVDIQEGNGKLARKRKSVEDLSSRSTTPESLAEDQSIGMFEDDFDDIPLLQISPKVRKPTAVKRATKSVEKAPAAAVTPPVTPMGRGRSLRRKKIINYALLEDGRSLSSMSDYEIPDFDDESHKTVKDTPKRDKPETETPPSKRRLSDDSSLDSAPLLQLKNKMKKRKKSLVERKDEDEVNQEDSYVNLQVSQMKEALDSLRDQVKESESRNMELESKLITLTQTNGKLSKELASVTHNAGNFERELDAQKKKYEKDLSEFEAAKTNLVSLFNAIKSKNAEMSQIKVFSERISLESEKLKKDLEDSKNQLENLSRHKEQFETLKRILVKVFRDDDELCSSRVETPIESDSDICDVIAGILVDYVETKKHISTDYKNFLERIKRKDDLLAQKDRHIKEHVKGLNEIKLTINAKDAMVEELKRKVSRLESNGTQEVEHLKMDRSRNIQKIQELRKEMKEKEAEHVKAIQKYAAEIESRKGQFKMSYSEKDRQISQLSSKVREKEAEASRLRADHQTKIAQISKLETELLNLKAQRNGDVSSRQKEIDEIKWARSHCLEMDNKVKDLENQIKAEKDRNKSREQKESELLSKVNQLAQEVRQKDEKIQRHEKTLQNIVSTNKSATEEVKVLKKTIEESKKNLEELKAKYAAEVSNLKAKVDDKEDEIGTLKLQLDVENLVRSESQNLESSDLPETEGEPAQGSSRGLGLNPNLTPYTQMTSTIEIFPENLEIVKKEES